MEGDVSNTLPKKERLCGKTAVSRLLAKGKHGSVPGLRYICLYDKDTEVSRIMISVPKKLFKRAVRRNLLKRRIRESWRRQKQNLALEGSVDILFIYTEKDIMSYADIYIAIGRVIESLNSRYGNKPAAVSVEGAGEAIPEEK